jgi:hypothetical protein
MLHLEMNAFPDTLLRPERHAFPNACINLIGARPSCFASPPTVLSLDSRIFIAAELFQQTKMKGYVTDNLVSRHHCSQRATD